MYEGRRTCHVTVFLKTAKRTYVWISRSISTRASISVFISLYILKPMTDISPLGVLQGNKLKKKKNLIWFRTPFPKLLLCGENLKGNYGFLSNTWVFTAMFNHARKSKGFTFILPLPGFTFPLLPSLSSAEAKTTLCMLQVTPVGVHTGLRTHSCDITRPITSTVIWSKSHVPP